MQIKKKLFLKFCTQKLDADSTKKKMYVVSCMYNLQYYIILVIFKFQKYFLHIFFGNLQKIPLTGDKNQEYFLNVDFCFVFRIYT